jgi:glycolate oxidase iron-sulfur subunit
VERVGVESSDECCGGAGIYGLLHPDLGGRIGSDKVDAVLESGADVVATGNPGCIMQIGAGLRMAGSGLRVVHPVEILDESYRRAGMYREEEQG